MQQVHQFIRRLSSHGVKFALDDFGTGVSSLAYLKNLDINTIKLDGSYVVDVLTNPRSQALVRAIVQLADAMGITTVAEFVESDTVRDRLASLGIQFGYLISATVIVGWKSTARAPSTSVRQLNGDSASKLSAMISS